MEEERPIRRPLQLAWQEMAEAQPGMVEMQRRGQILDLFPSLTLHVPICNSFSTPFPKS